MSIIPQRPPDTPLLTFYTTGKYDKQVTYPQFKQSSAIPGYSATINERNRSPYEEIDVKTITQKSPDQRHYDPKKYLKPYEGERYSPDQHKDVSLNSISYNNVMNQKRQIEQNKFGKNGIPTGSVIEKNDFVIRRRQGEMSPQLRMSGSGQLICEKILQASRDEQEYFNNKKIFTKEQDPSHYKRQIPDYMRVLDQPNNQPKLDCPDGMISIVSKNQGWITVTPKGMNRKRPLEKGGIDGDVTKTSILTPSWMQIGVPRQSYDHMQGTIQKGLRQENNRTFLTDKVQPKKSIFAIGNFRHNVAFQDQVDKFKGQVQEPVRLMEWKEDQSKQSYDAKVSTKIGSFHESPIYQ